MLARLTTDSYHEQTTRVREIFNGLRIVYSRKLNNKEFKINATR